MVANSQTSTAPTFFSGLLSVFRVIARVWRILLIVYYVIAVLYFCLLLIQNGPDLLKPSQFSTTLTQALFLDHLFLLAHQHILVGVVLLVIVVILTIISVAVAIIDHFRPWRMGPTSQPIPGSASDRRIQQIEEWLSDDPDFRPLLLTLLGEQMLPAIKDILHNELGQFERSQVAPWVFTSILGLIGIVGPLATLINGIVQTLH